MSYCTAHVFMFGMVVTTANGVAAATTAAVIALFLVLGMDKATDMATTFACSFALAFVASSLVTLASSGVLILNATKSTRRSGGPRRIVFS